MVYDIIIIGAGPGGMSAAIYAQRSGLDVLILEKNVPGGLVNQTNIVENYLGFPNISGPDLALKMFEHIKSLEIPYKIREVKKIKKGKIKTIVTNDGEFKCKSIIIATGRSNKKLPLPNAEKLEGKGISYCALCDANLYKGKVVGVIGGGNSAFEEGSYLAKVAKEVIILNRGEVLIADDELEAEMKEKKNVTIKLNARVKELLEEDNKLTGVKLTNGETINLDGLFVYIGYAPATAFLKNLKITNDYGYILVNKDFETDVPGIFACGDIIKKSIYQIVTATSEGAEAAINAYKYIKTLK